jgi:ABC-type transporter Mla maintaining outer membrane lipid asymmetry ATPase subunit MlaF
MSESNSNANPVALAMRGVTVSSLRDAAVTVAHEVDWTVRAGEFWVVAGPQRSGKSALLMLAGGLTAPARGTYHFFGEPMPIFEDEGMAHRLKLGFVFDGGQLFSRMTVAENLALPLSYHEDLPQAETASRVRELMELLELREFAHRLPAGLARNWQKRAGLARALILKPTVLLVDNPLSGLDARHTAWWLNFLEQLCAGHSFMGGPPMTIVVTTDDLPRVAGGLRKPCHFAVMNDEKFIVVGDREQLYASRDPGVRELLMGEETARTD